MYLTPATGSYPVGSNITVSVRVNTEGANINTAEASLTFSGGINLSSVSQGKTFYLAAPGSPGKGNGTAYLAGGLPTPGYNGTGGQLGTLTFRARSVGTAVISVVDGKLLLNDGNGTNAITGKGLARFTITEPVAPPPSGGLVTVTSGSHPDPNAWYSTNNVDLFWNRPNNAYGFSFILDQMPSTIPDDQFDVTTETTKTYLDVTDGVWYFHIKASGAQQKSPFGETTHFKVNVDTTPPDPFPVDLAEKLDPLKLTTQTPSVAFEAKDSLSGAYRYDLYLNNELVKENVSSPYRFEKMEYGAYTVKVVAYDRAGNGRESSLDLNIVPPVTPVTSFFSRRVCLPLFWLLFLLPLLLVIILLLLVSFFRRRKKDQLSSEEKIDPKERLKREIAARVKWEIEQELNMDVKKLRKQVDEDVVNLTSKAYDDLLRHDFRKPGQK